LGRFFAISINEESLLMTIQGTVDIYYLLVLFVVTESVNVYVCICM